MKKKHELIKEAYDRYPKGTVARFKDEPNTDHVSDGIFQILDINHDGTVGIYSGAGLNCFYLSHDEDGKVINEWAEIIPAEPEKAGLLDGKCAIHVNNEREFKVLMEHYEAKGWNWSGGDTPTTNSTNIHRQLSLYNYNTSVMYKDDFLFNPADDDWKIIPFADFAAEVGITVPVFVMKSEDGVDLYERDKYYRAGRCKPNATGDFVIYEQEELQGCHFVCCYPETDKPFYTKEAALEWIEEMNKPKEIIIGEHEKNPYAIVRADRIRFTSKTDSIMYEFSGEEIQEIYATYKSLQ